MADTPHYDTIVIGSGPAGYVCAIRLAQLGFKTAIVERYKTLGGTCLNVGCIPSKALLDSSEHYHNALHNFKAHGIEVNDLGLNFEKMIGRKDKVVKSITKGVEFLMKKNKITHHQGHASFTGPNSIQVAKDDGSTEQLQGDKIIIATGSKPASLPGAEIDKDRIISSTEALSLPEVPDRMLVIGAGYIGLEMGSVYARLGTNVEVLEFMDQALPAMDLELGKELQKILKKELSFKFHFQHKVKHVKNTGKQVTVTVETDQGEEVEMRADYCLVAVGRKPFTKELGLDQAGVQLDEKGFVPVNGNFQTNVPNVYAIGDVVGGKMLAHKGSEEGIFLAEQLAGHHPHLNYHCIPGVVYTWPEVASVGYTEEEIQAQGIAYKSGKFPYQALGRAKAAAENNGWVKVLAREDNDEILGVHLIGARAADLIAEGVTSMEFRAAAEDMAMFSHAHPTFAEAMKEAAMAATGDRAIHM
jgi:dihydrolipoamide dehydrogenase